MITADIDNKAWLAANRGALIYWMIAVFSLGLVGLSFWLFGSQWISALTVHIQQWQVPLWLRQQSINSPAELIAFLAGFKCHFFAILVIVVHLPLIVLLRRPIPTSLLRGVGRSITLSFLYLGLSQIVVFTFVQYPGLQNVKNWNFKDTILAQAPPPMNYRLLTPLVIRLIHASLPEPFRLETQHSLRKSRFFQHLSRNSRNVTDMEVAYAIFIVVMILCFTGVLTMLARLAHCTLPLNRFHCDVGIPIVFSLLYPILFIYTNYTYDIPNLLFSLMGYWLMLQRRWWLYLTLYPFALLNKESFILMTVIFAILMFGKLEWRWYLSYLGYQLICFIAIKFVLLRVLFNLEPGFHGIFVNMLGANIHWLYRQNIWYFLIGWQQTLYFFPNLIYPLLLLAIGYRWRRKNVYLRHAFVVGFTFLTTVNFLMTTFEEWRGYTELFPLVILLAYPSLLWLCDDNRESET